MIKGIGIDISDKRRMRDTLARLGDKFLERVLTAREMEAMPSNRDRQVEYVAGRFAAKEAFAKATGWGIGKDLSWQDMEITNDSLGKPVIQLSNSWLEMHDPKRNLVFHISISHEKNYAVAQIIIEEIR